MSGWYWWRCGGGGESLGEVGEVGSGWKRGGGERGKLAFLY